jgi:hypothetical protein
MTLLRRSYELLLMAYPKETRKAHQDQLDLLLEVSKPNQLLPDVGEARAIMREGLTARITTQTGTTPTAIVADGLRRGVLFAMFAQIAWLMMMFQKSSASDEPSVRWIFGGWSLMMIALAEAWSRRPSRAVITVWQLAGVVGGVWFALFAASKVDEPARIAPILIVVVCVLALSSTIGIAALILADVTAQALSQGLKPFVASSFAIVLALGIAVRPVGSIVCLVAALGAGVLMWADPRRLIGLSISMLVPLTLGSVAVLLHADQIDARAMRLPLVTLVAASVVGARGRVLVRRLEDAHA